MAGRPWFTYEFDFVQKIAARLSRAIQAMVISLDADANDAVTAVGLTLLFKVQAKTPVDTGRLRASWHMIPPNSQSDPFSNYQDLLGRTFLGNLQAPRTGPGEVIVGTNVPYGIFIEAGHSIQAPRGMLSVSMIEIFGQLEKELDTRLGASWREAIGRG